MIADKLKSMKNPVTRTMLLDELQQAMKIENWTENKNENKIDLWQEDPALLLCTLYTHRYKM